MPGRSTVTAIRIVQPNIGQEDKWRPGLADEAFTRLFPRTVASPLTAYDTLGLGAGRSAADAAMLDVRDSIAG